MIENLTLITKILTEFQTKVKKKTPKNCQNFGCPFSIWNPAPLIFQSYKKNFCLQMRKNAKKRGLEADNMGNWGNIAKFSLTFFYTFC